MNNGVEGDVQRNPDAHVSGVVGKVCSQGLRGKGWAGKNKKKRKKSSRQDASGGRRPGDLVKRYM